jgi:hypothetical protein
MRLAPPFAFAVIACTVVACGSEGRAAPAVATRDTLPDGTILVRYERLLEPAGTPLTVDLTIGVAEGDPNLIFGDIRGVEAGSDGTIYILDYLASEVRAFDAAGRYLRTLTSKGAGPGELMEANGMLLVGDTALWIQDHGQWMMIAVDLTGEELTRFRMPVLEYGYVWNGTLDTRGRLWNSVTHSDEPRENPPREGLHEGHARAYLKSYDPRTDVSDSISLGELSYRMVIARNTRGGYTYRGVPHTPETITIVDPAGGFWQAGGLDYRIARLDRHGDTTMIIEVGSPPVAVTDRERQRYVEQVAEESPGDRRVAEQIAALMPAHQPAIARLVMDDAGRLWAGRTATEGAASTYDLFRPDGEYVGAVAFGFHPAPSIPIRVRHGRVYAVVRDSLDIPSVVRTRPIPAFAP